VIELLYTCVGAGRVIHATHLCAIRHDNDMFFTLDDLLRLHFNGYYRPLIIRSTEHLKEQCWY
jgi:hypothetical protein